MSDDKLIFVGGSMRAGTTILQRILCSSPGSIPVIGECQYLTQQFYVYHRALEQFELFHGDFFSSKATVEEFTKGIISDFLALTRQRYAPATTFVLKHPELTKFFPRLAKWFSHAKFVVIVRDPRDTIASMLEVTSRQRENDVDFFMTRFGRDMKKFSHYYKAIYAPVFRKHETLRNSLLIVRYEQLLEERTSVIDALSSFCGLTFDYESFEKQPLSDEHTTLDGRRRENDKFSSSFWTPLYTKGLSSERIGRYRESLSEQEITDIESACADFNAVCSYW